MVGLSLNGHLESVGNAIKVCEVLLLCLLVNAGTCDGFSQHRFRDELMQPVAEIQVSVVLSQ